MIQRTQGQKNEKWNECYLRKQIVRRLNLKYIPESVSVSLRPLERLSHLFSPLE